MVPTKETHPDSPGEPRISQIKSLQAFLYSELKAPALMERAQAKGGCFTPWHMEPSA